ncbi:ABC transporter permease [Mesorhizobium sp. RSR380A]|uniref:ABC transporter permease n=1 Tax=unclassified Mesorhizobium TaxID=325217 RepID=UPI0003CF8728|nr:MULTISPECIES: ABC transporter permease [unclassified Mesorhizobium]ESW67697.1 ABC transporter permease [Mesorhizobium sp. LSJC277A00]ESX63183.1 ABC transporter permease [Mesorhizobium sp. LSHC422A00]ESY50221.1 ABC transporter permease [Mesorhizobium sp. LNJC380A00]ESZ49233.1 ABC transporter permease [Mesorhizobium sp. L103C565B0]
MSASEPIAQPAADVRPGRAWRPFALTAPALILLVAVIGYPLLTIVLRSLSEPEWGLQNYAWFFGAPVNLTVLQRTFVISAWVTLVCVIAAYPYAYLMTAVGPRVRLVLVLCVLIPFWVSGVVRTLSWVILLQDSGVINSLLRSVGFGGVKLIRTQTGVVIGMAQVLLPFMILPLYSVMQGIDLRLMRAAQSLGARPSRAFFTVYLPLSLPGVYAGAIIVFILSLGFYITPALLGGPRSTMLSTLVQTQVLSLLQWGRGGAMGVVLLVTTFVLLALAAPVMRSSHREAGRR